MPFDAPPKLLYTGLGQYELLEDFCYRGREQVLTVPKGFETDLASVPRAFWQFIPPFGGYEAAAVLHDYLCVALASNGPKPVNARDTDGLFRRIMREEGVGFVARWVMWVGVRWGAVANPARRAGWLRDAPLVLPLSSLLLLVTLLVVAGVHEFVDRIGSVIF